MNPPLVVLNPYAETLTTPQYHDQSPASTSSRLHVADLRHEVMVYRDEWSIPHIKAGSEHDAFVALGYVHAQDRLWQMDSSRRRMFGQWAQWAGASAVAGDALARRLGVARASQRDYAALKPETKAMLEAYSAGVNALLREGRPLPLEYQLLNDTVAEWQPWHSIAVMRHRGFLMGSVWFKLWRAAALRTIGAGEIAKLRYDDDNGDLLCFPPGAQSQRWIATLQELAPAIAAISQLAGPDATGGGSNNWAIAPTRTASGRPLLAGDPHRVFEMPGMYLQTHVACDSFDAIGFSVPGVPGFPHFAHNGQVAWCVTHAFADIHDLFVEHFAHGGSQYQYQGKWLDTVQRREQIVVRGAAAVDIDIIETHHGPVIAGTPAQGSALTLRSVQFAMLDRSFDCLLPMLKASTVQQLFEATRGWGLIDHHLVAADRSGQIGHLLRAVVPKRPRLNGWLPVPGWTGDYEWNGEIPWHEMPRALDPARGYLVSANNRITFEPNQNEAENYLCTDCHPPYRARRIEHLLSLLPKASLKDMERIHRDDLSATAPLFRDAVRALPPQPGQAGELQILISAWDCHMRPDSRAAAAYSSMRWQLARIVAQRSRLAQAADDSLAQVAPGVVPVNQLWWALPSLLRSNDIALLDGWSWPQAIAHALQAIAAQCAENSWAQIHPTLLTHPLAAQFPTQRDLLNPAGAAVGGDNDTVWANGCYSATGMAASYGAVARYVFDVGAWENSRWIVMAGVSGDPASPHYADQHQAWAQCQMVPMRYDWAGIIAVAHKISSQPA